MMLQNAGALWLLASLPLVWLLAWRNRTSRPPRRLAAAMLLRSAALALLALALAQPVIFERRHEVSVVYAIDISRSVSSAFLRQALDWIGAANARYRPAHIRYVVFADRAKLVDSATEVLLVPVAAEDGAAAPDAIDQAATDLEQALHTALFGFAPNHARRLVLLSDGNQTQGDLWRMLPRLRAEGVKVFAVPAALSADSDTWVESITVPEGVRQQEPVAVSVRLFSRTRTSARVRLTRGARILATRVAALRPGENEVVLEVRLPEAGGNVISAEVAAHGDQVERNNRLSESVWVAARPRVLYVEGTPESAHYLAEALRTQHIDVRVESAGTLAADPGLLEGQDAVILSDVRAQSLDPQTLQALVGFVRDKGGGLIFAAGENTYGKQGFAGSTVEQLLPVRFEGKRERRELDLVLLIDRSHSMRGRKLELAKSAALASLDLLEEQHRLAVVAFDSRAHEVVPLAEVGNKRRAEDLIASMASSGQTNIYTGLARAQRVLADSTASTKHIILLSDGVTAPPPGTATARSSSEEAHELVRRARAETIRQAGGRFEPEPLPEPAAQADGIAGLVAELARANVTLSTVAIGERPNLELMSELAAWGNGKSYVAESDSEIPGLFVAETRRLLGESIVEGPFRPAVANRVEAIAGLDFAAAPALKGFVITRPKQFADVLLKAPDEQPLLVQTHYGLGKTVAFLSDVKNRWAADWLGWEGYGRFWSQVVRDTIPRSAGAGLSWHVVRQGREALIELRALAADRTWRNGLAPKARLTHPDGPTSVVALRQVGPGRYRASTSLRSGHSAPYRFEMLQGGGISRGDLARLGTRMLAYPWSEEYRLLPPDNALLRALSERTGGVFSPRADEIFAPRGDGGIVLKSLWPWLAAAALLAFLLDILVRRAPWFALSTRITVDMKDTAENRA